MKARIKHIEGMAFLAEAGSGHGIVLDASAENGGRNLGMRPLELLLMGLGGCSAFDVMLILTRGRQPVADCVVDVEAERAESDPKVFTKIHLDYTVTGAGLDPSKVERAIALSKEKYCSASIMLAQVATITHSWKVIDPRDGAVVQNTAYA